MARGNGGWGVFLAGLILLVLSTGSQAASQDRSRQFKADMKGADAASRVKLIGAYAESGGIDAASAIHRYATSPDFAVRRAALTALGTLRAPKLFARIHGLVKTFGKDPETLAEVLRALGRYEDPRAIKTLKRTAKKWLPRDSRVAGAAAEALGRIPHRNSVELLIDLLDLTSPSLPSNSDKNISTETRRMLRESRPSIIQALQNLTGWDFRDAAAWSRFWKLEGRNWKPNQTAQDPADRMHWTDPGYGFRIERPDAAWQFDRSQARAQYRIFLSREVEGRRAAYIHVWAARDHAGLSTALKAEESLDRHRGRMKDIREQSIEISDLKIGKLRGTLLRFVGLDSYGSAALVEERFVKRDGMVFVISSWRRTGLPEEIAAEVERGLESFTLLD